MTLPIEEISSRHRQYDGYDLVAHYVALIPIWKLSLNVMYSADMGLNTLEWGIASCLLHGMTDKEDIMQVLGIDNALFAYSVTDLLRIKPLMISIDGQSITLTEEGRKNFAKQVKPVRNISASSIPLFVNALWPDSSTLVDSINKHSLISQDEVAKLAENSILMFAPIWRPQPNTLMDHSERVHRALCSSYENAPANIEIQQCTATESTLLFHPYLLLVYTSCGHYRMIAYDHCGLSEIDPEATRHFIDLSRAGSIDEYLKGYSYNSAHLNALTQTVDSYRNGYVNFLRSNSQNTSSEKELETTERQYLQYIMNAEHEEKLEYALNNAKERLYIISPWINDFFAKRVDKKFDALLKRGVEVAIICGIDKLPDRHDDRSLKTETIRARLQERFEKAGYAHQFRTAWGNTHEKFLLVDNEFVLTGSLNFLSYSSDKTDSDKGFRNESSLLITDPAFIKYSADRFNQRFMPVDESAKAIT